MDLYANRFINLEDKLTTKLKFDREAVYHLFNDVNLNENNKTLLASYNVDNQLQGVLELDNIYTDIDIYSMKDGRRGLLLQGDGIEICYEGEVLEINDCPNIKRLDSDTNVTKGLNMTYLTKDNVVTLTERVDNDYDYKGGAGVFCPRELNYNYDDQVVNRVTYTPVDYDFYHYPFVE